MDDLKKSDSDVHATPPTFNERVDAQYKDYQMKFAMPLLLKFQDTWYNLGAKVAELKRDLWYKLRKLIKGY